MPHDDTGFWGGLVWLVWIAGWTLWLSIVDGWWTDLRMRYRKKMRDWFEF